MTTKILFLLLGTFIVVQTCLGTAIPDVEETTPTETITTERTPIEILTTEPTIPTTTTRLQYWDEEYHKFFYYILTEFFKIAVETMNSGQQILKDIVNQISNMDNKNEEVIKYLETYKILIDRVEYVRKEEHFSFVDEEEYRDDVVRKLIELENLLEETDENSNETSKTDKFFNNLLQKHGSRQIWEKFDEGCNKIIDDVIEKFSFVLNTTTIEDFPERKEMEEWLNNFRAAEGIQKRADTLNKYFF